MVYFICQACQETLKKAQVEKHWTSACPRCYILTCVDCSVEFKGDEYRAHNTCISEAEKYQGALYQGGKADKKSPQDKWMDALHAAAAAATGSTAKHMAALQDYPNVPRKKPKFVNFARNSLNLHSEALLHELFDAIAKQLPSSAPAAAAGGSAAPAQVGGVKRPRSSGGEVKSDSPWVGHVTSALAQGPLKKSKLRSAVAKLAGEEADSSSVKKGVKKALGALADLRKVTVVGKMITLAQ